MQTPKRYTSLVDGTPVGDGHAGGGDNERPVFAAAETADPAAAPVAMLVDADEQTVAAACAAARRAAPAWAALSRPERATALNELAAAVEARTEELARIEARDTGRPIAETRADIAATVDQFRYFAAALRVQQDATVQHDQHSYSMIESEPYGVAGLIIPWNFPFLIAGWKLAPALAAGNTCIIKPAELAPCSIFELGLIAAEVLPVGVLNVIGGAAETGAALCAHPEVDIISFTGSPTTGRRVAAAAAERLVPVHLELGGKSANIVFPDAPWEKAMATAPATILYASGQMCNAGSRLLLHHDIYDRFLDELTQRFRAIRPGDPLQESTRMGPLISREQFEVVRNYIDTGRSSGARLLCGGERLSGRSGTCDYNCGYFMEPTIFADVEPDSRIAQEEIFGPVLCVIPFSDEAEAIEIANNSAYGLAGGVWTRDGARGIRVARAVKTGTMWVNEYNLVPSGSPFGGYRNSGYGREVHKHAMAEFSQTKNIFVSLSDEAYDWYAT